MGKITARRKLIFAGIIIFLIALIIAVYYYIRSRDYQSTDDAFIEGHIVGIAPKVSGTVQNVNIRDNQKVKQGDLIFIIDPKDYITRVNEAKGALASAIAQRNASAVNLGLTDITTRAGITQAKAGVNYAESGVEITSNQIDIAKSNYAGVIARVEEARSNIGQLRAAVIVAQAQSELASEDLRRIKSLFQEGAVSRQQLDTAIANERAAIANLEESRLRVRSAQAIFSSAISAQTAALKNINQTTAQLSQARSNITQARGRLRQLNTLPQNLALSRWQLNSYEGEIKRLKASLVQAKLMLSYTRIYAPITGYITNKAVEKGSFVQTGQLQLSIVPDKVWIIANYKETQLTRMRAGQRAYIKVDTYPGKVFKGHVDSIQRGSGAAFSLLPPENAVGSYVKVVQRIPVKIVFDEPPDTKILLVPGMSVVPEVKIR